MRLLAPFVLIALALAVVVWLDDTRSDADLVFVNQNEVFTLDPQRMSYIQDLRLAHALYEGLVRWNNFDFSVLPAAATQVPEPSEDGRTYRFRIDPAATWSNGDPVTAHDFIYAWQRAILPDTAADYSNLFFTIAGAEAFFTWRAEQTAGFTADPWDDPAAASAEAVAAAARRLRRLLDAEDLPPAVRRPADADRPRLAGELDRLLDAAAAAADDANDAQHTTLEVELESSSACRAWHDALEEDASRTAESEWMWQRAQHRFDETVGLEAPDARTLVVTLERPTAYFLDLLCFGVFFPVHRPTVEGWPDAWPISAEGWHAGDAPPFTQRRWVSLSAASGKVEQKHEWSKPERHVGNGPYLLREWRYKRDLLLERNPTYRARDLVKNDSILAITIEDTNTAVLAFESGHVDWLADVSAEYQADMIEQRERYVERYAAAIEKLTAAGLSLDAALARQPAPERGERRNIHVFRTFGTDFYSFNCREVLDDDRANPFADAAVRRAFVLAVDKQRIVDHVTRLREPVLTTLIPPGSIGGYASPAGLPHDPTRARAELKGAGWEDRDGDGIIEDADGRPFPVIDLLYTTNIPRYKWISLDLKAQWERVLGVRVELRGEETKFYKEDLKQGRFMIARGRWYGDYGDPTTFLELCRTNDGNNDRAFSDPRVDDLLDRAARERDPSTRMAQLEECERIIVVEEVPMLVLCQLVQVYMYEPGKVKGLSTHPRLTQFLWQMEIEK